MEQFDALDVIARTRGKVEMDAAPSGDRIFLIWGVPTAVCFALQFIFWMWLHEVWCLFFWVLMPLVGVPLTIREVKADRERTHFRTYNSRIVMDYWMFVAVVSCAGGFIFGFADLSFVCFYPLVALLIGLGGFITGEVARYRPMIACGLAGAAVGIASFLLQGPALSAWQLMCDSAVAVISLVIPGYMYFKHFADGVQRP